MRRFVCIPTQVASNTHTHAFFLKNGEFFFEARYFLIFREIEPLDMLIIFLSLTVSSSLIEALNVFGMLSNFKDSQIITTEYSYKKNQEYSYKNEIRYIPIKRSGIFL